MYALSKLTFHFTYCILIGGESQGYVNLKYLLHKLSEIPQSSQKLDIEHQSTVMDRRYTRNFRNHQNSSVVPIILYLTLPNVTHQGISKNIQNGMKTKSRKQQQRDQNRLNNFIERKMVCSEFPFYSLDNAEIQAVAPKQITPQNSKPAHFYISKLNSLQQENTRLQSTITQLEDCNRRLANTEEMITDLRSKVSNGENKLKIANSVISNLKQEISIKDKKADSVIDNLRQLIIDKEKRNVILVDELKVEVLELKHILHYSVDMGEGKRMLENELTHIDSILSLQIDELYEEQTPTNTTSRSDVRTTTDMQTTGRKSRRKGRKPNSNRASPHENQNIVLETPSVDSADISHTDDLHVCTGECKVKCLMKKHLTAKCPEIKCRDCGSLKHHKVISDCPACPYWSHTDGSGRLTLKFGNH